MKEQVMAEQRAKLSDPHVDYWMDALGYALEGIDRFDLFESLTLEQRQDVAQSLRTSAECESQAFYSPEPPSVSEADRLRAELAAERRKIICRSCNGTGTEVSYGGTMMSRSQCWKCRGDGRHAP